MSDGATELKFEIYRGGALVRTEMVAHQSKIKIGKLPSSQLRLDDPNVSRSHAIIEPSGDGYQVVDLGSTKGTYVNGARTNKSPLSPGDRIQVGDTELVVFFGGAAAAAASAPAAAPAAAVAVDLSAGSGDAGLFGGVEEETQVGGDAGSLGGLGGLGGLSASGGLSAVSKSISGGFSSAPKPGGLSGGGLSALAGGFGGGSEATEEASGWYDDAGNWHDGMGGYYDPDGNYHDQYGGYYDPDGNYFDGQGGYYDPDGNYFEVAEPQPVIRDTDVYSESYLEKDYDSTGKGTLEVALLWNDHVISVNHYHKPKEITVGKGENNTLAVEHDAIPNDAFPIVKPVGGKIQVNFTKGMTGLVYVDDNRYTLDEAIASGAASQGGFGPTSYTLTMSPRTRVRLDFGLNTVLVHYANVPMGLPTGGFSIDAGLFGFLLLSFLLHASFMFLAFYIPPNPQAFELDSFDVNNRFITQVVKPQDEIKEEEPDWLKEKKKDKPKEAAAKAAGSEGKAGRKDKKPSKDDANKRMAVKGDSTNKSEVKLAKDMAVAQNTGALSVLNNSALAASFGSGTVSSGFDPITAMGGASGDKIGESYGFGAFGATGAGRGGGGVAENSFGVGGFGSGGKGVIGGTNVGKNVGNIQERATKVPVVVPGAPAVTGALSKEMIRRVIRRHRREVKYCYEQELIKNKSLSGRITIQFTISGTGRVAGAVPAGNTMGNAAVANCIVGKVRRWVFPEPKGGGIVVVKYPFVFSSK